MLPYACQNDYLLYWQQGRKKKKDDGKKQIFSKIPMITDRNQALFAKMSSCGGSYPRFPKNLAGQKAYFELSPTSLHSNIVTQVNVFG